MTENKLLEEILKIIKTTSNDMVLGEKIRKIYNQFINSEK
jgi:hypothetical protein